MGYELHIEFETPDGADEPPPIPDETWFAWIEAQDDFERRERMERRLPDGRLLTMETPRLAIWHDGGREVPFGGTGASISVKNTDDAIIRRMLDVADDLGAVVVGDEGERYVRTDTDSGYRIEGGPTEEELTEADRARKEALRRTREAVDGKPDPEDLAAIRRPWWKKLLGL